MEKNTAIITPAGEIVEQHPELSLSNSHYVYEDVHIEISQRTRKISSYTLAPEISSSVFVFKHDGRTMHLLVRYDELPTPQTSASAKLTLHRDLPVVLYEPANVVLGEIDNYTKGLIQTAINHVIIRRGTEIWENTPEGYLVSLLRRLPIMGGRVRIHENIITLEEERVWIVSQDVLEG